MQCEDLIIKSHGTCGILETDSKERLQTWDDAIILRYTELKKIQTEKNLRIEWLKEEDKNTIKIKVNSIKEKSKDKQGYTITLYRGENSKKLMIQSKDVNFWKNLELNNIKYIVNEKKPMKK